MNNDTDTMPEVIYAHIYGKTGDEGNDFGGCIWGSGDKYIDKYQDRGEKGGLYVSAETSISKVEHEALQKVHSDSLGFINYLQKQHNQEIQALEDRLVSELDNYLDVASPARQKEVHKIIHTVMAGES